MGKYRLKHPYAIRGNYNSSTKFAHELKFGECSKLFKPYEKLDPAAEELSILATSSLPHREIPESPLETKIVIRQ